MEGCKGSFCNEVWMGHSVACRYEEALSVLNLKDSVALRQLFWFSYGRLEWDAEAGVPEVPALATDTITPPVPLPVDAAGHAGGQGHGQCAAVMVKQQPLVLSGRELVDLVNFTCPDYHSDPDQLNTEVVLRYHDATDATPEMEAQAAGIYVYLSEYPEEGAYGPVGTLIPATPDAP